MLRRFNGLGSKWLVVVLAIGALLVLSCAGQAPDTPEETNLDSVVAATPESKPVPTATPASKPVPTATPTTDASPSSAVQPSGEFMPTIGVSNSGCAGGYNRDDWAPSSSRWSAARQATAREEGPGLFGYWTDLPIASLSQADIDHHVPVKHAHMAGGCHWDKSRRGAFYTDLDNLNVTTPSMNRSKSDKAPGHWARQDEFIDTPSERCEYATQWVSVKRKYELHFITAQEVSELKRMLSGCGETPSLPSSAAPRARTPSPEPADTQRPALGEVKVYKNCAELREDYPDGITKTEHPEVYAANESRDRDKDGSACERAASIGPTAIPTAISLTTPTPAATDTTGEVKVYKNCAELREDYPDGITKTEYPEVYAANESRDRDKDGSACE